MKISLIGSYSLADGYLGAAKALRSNGVEVDFIPAHRYYSEFPSNHVDKIIEDLRVQNPDVVLWWRSETLEANELFRVKKEIGKKHIVYSWDDPHQFDDKMRNVKGKISAFDACFTCCEGSIKDYKDNGCSNVFYCPPGYDPEVHFPEEDEEYKCDISLVCTNLYHGISITKKMHISRKTLMEKIISNFPNLDIRIYGSENIKNDFPKNYKGWIPFDKSRKVFCNSKINISTHIRPDGYKYFNERVPQIMGSGGFLLVDPVCGLGEVIDINECCNLMDFKTNNSIIYQIKNILKNDELRNKIKENGQKFALENLTWNNWAKKIMENI